MAAGRVVTTERVVPVTGRIGVARRGQNVRPDDTATEAGLARRVAVTTGVLMAARIVVVAAGIVTLGLAARYLRLQAFGELTTAMAFSSMFAVLADLGLSTVATREISRDPSRESSVLGSALTVGCLGAVGLVALGAASMGLFYGGEGDAGVRRAILILLSQLIAVPITGTARAQLTARQRGHLIAFGDIALSLGMAVFTAIAVAAGLGYQGVVIAITGGYFTQAAVMGALMLRCQSRLDFDRAVAGRLLRDGLPFAGTLVLNYLYFRLDVFLLSWLKSDVDVARYGLAYRVLEGLMVLPSYVMLTLFPVLARGTEDRRSLARTVGMALGVLEAIALPVGALVAIFSPEIVVLLGGHGYAPAAPALAILGAALAVSYLAGVYGNAVMAMGSGRALFRITLGPLGVNLVLNLILIPPFGIVGAAIAVTGSELVGLFLVRRYYTRLAGRVDPPPHGRVLAAGLSFVLIAVLKFLLVGTGSPLLVVGLGAPLSVLVYLGVLVKLRVLPAEIVNRVPFLARTTTDEGGA